MKIGDEILVDGIKSTIMDIWDPSLVEAYYKEIKDNYYICNDNFYRYGLISRKNGNLIFLCHDNSGIDGLCFNDFLINNLNIVRKEKIRLIKELISEVNTK